MQESRAVVLVELFFPYECRFVVTVRFNIASEK